MTGPDRQELRYARRRQQRRIVAALLGLAALLTLGLTWYLAASDRFSSPGTAAGRATALHDGQPAYESFYTAPSAGCFSWKSSETQRGAGRPDRAGAALSVQSSS